MSESDETQPPLERGAPDFASFPRFFDEYFDRAWLLLAYSLRPARPTEQAMEAVMSSLAMEWASGAEHGRLQQVLRQGLKDARALAQDRDAS